MKFKSTIAAVRRTVISAALVLGVMFWGYAQQTTITGTVTDADTGEGIAGVNIIVKGRVVGTITDVEGYYNLTVNQAPPFTLVYSSVGYSGKEVEITDSSPSEINIELQEGTLLGEEVVISASRVEENILKSPVTIEKMDLIDIQQTASTDFYDGIANLKGVHVSQGAINFPAVNTRGFGAVANERFVQLIDGMDNSAPVLNFPTGNLTGFSELDAESVELVPGAASALYGPNAFNGILLMRSKNPFEYQGLSAQLKGGVTTSDAQKDNPAFDEWYPLFGASIRYAKAFNDKWAFKVNFSFLDAQDWIADDYDTHRRFTIDDPWRYPGTSERPQSPDFDGVNLYGDETLITAPFPEPVTDYGPISFRRTGLPEQDLIEDYEARSIKGDIAIHHRINDKVEASLSYRYGGGSSVYYGGEKYALRDFTQQFIKAEATGDNFFVRGYMTMEDAGDSYNLSALGAFANEGYSPTETQWAPNYVGNYISAILGYVPFIPGADEEAAHAYARQQTDAVIPARGSEAYRSVIEQVRNARFQTENGAKLVANGRLYHAEFNYNFMNQIDWIEIQVGGNFRRYDLSSDGTIFNEDPEGDGDFERIGINEFGVYTQLAKGFIDDKLNIRASLRYDKNENFEGQVTPRVAAVFEFIENQNFRASYQTGFRNPQTQAQFIYFPSSTGTLLGSVPSNAERYGVHLGGAYSLNSYQQFLATGNPADLQIESLDYVQPEQLRVWEFGYKGLFGNKFLIDINYYNNRYTDFIGQQTVALKETTTHRGNPVYGVDDLVDGSLPQGASIELYRPYVNSEEVINSWGLGVGFTYNLPEGFSLDGSFNHAEFSIEGTPSEDFQAGFNTPENRFKVGITNRNLFDNFGFGVSFRWQEEFLWENSFGSAIIPEYGVFDAQVNYQIESINTIVKVGAQNLAGGDYRTNIGGPYIGQQYFITLTYDQFLN